MEKHRRSGGHDRADAEPSLRYIELTVYPMSMQDEALLERNREATYSAREAAWRSLGELHPDVMAPMLNPSLMGGPMWPDLRQACVMVQRPAGTTLFASDGLTDPYSLTKEEAENPATAAFLLKRNGLEAEVYLETPDAVPIDTWARHWGVQLVYQLAQFVAQYPSFVTFLAKHALASIELYDVPVPDEWRNADGRVGVLVGLSAPDVPTTIELPISMGRLQSAKLLTPAELAHIVAHGEEGRSELVRLFTQQGSGHLSSLGRASVV